MADLQVWDVMVYDDNTCTPSYVYVETLKHGKAEVPFEGVRGRLELL